MIDHPRDPESPASADVSSDVSFQSVLRVLHRWKRLVFVLTLGLPFLTAVVMIFTPNKYTASGTILVETPKAGLGSELLGQITALAGLPTNVSTTDIYNAILQSRRVAVAVADQLKLVEHYRVKGKSPEARLEATLKLMDQRIKFDSSDLVTISIAAKDRDPQMAANIVNAYLDELGSANQTLAISRARRTRRLVEEALRQTAAELDSSLREMQHFQEKYGVFAMDKQMEGTLDLIGSLQTQLLSAQTERESLKGFSNESSSQLRNLELRINALHAQIRDMVGRLEKVLVVRNDEKVDEKKPVEPEKDPLESYFLPLRQLPNLGREYAGIAMHLEVQKAKYNLLATQLEQSKIDESQSVPAFEILDRAERPFRKSEPKRSLFVLGALVSGFLGGVLLAVLMDDLTRRVDPDTQEALLGLLPGFIRRRWSRVAGLGAQSLGPRG